MGNQKLRWTAEEEGALRAGVEKHGVGKWKNILDDPQFAPSLSLRFNTDLKYKWRNMVNMSTNYAAQGSKAKVMFPRIKSIESGQLTISQDTTTSLAEAVTKDPSKSTQDEKAASQYNVVIFEALSSVTDSNGSDFSTIASFIEQRHDVPQNFRTVLSLRLSRLVLQGKLEKVQDCYRIKKGAALVIKTPTPKQKEFSSKTPTPKQEFRRRPLQTSESIIPPETIQEAADTAARKIAEAENKLLVAVAAVEEAERISRMAEDTELLLQLVKDLLTT